MRAASLCAGIGGLDLILESFGHEIAWHAEYDIAPSKVLAHHWPGVPNIGDITTADWADCEPVDIITAGYPCQPFSAAGLRKGTDDDRHLWPFVRDAIAHLRPRYALLENVRGHLSLGFDTVLADLAAIGFDAEWGVLGSSDVGGCHRRQRLWVLATDARRPRGWEVTRGAHGDEGPDGEPLLDHFARRAGTSGVPATGEVALLPTPAAADGSGGRRAKNLEWDGGTAYRPSGAKASVSLQEAMDLLPTPTAWLGRRPSHGDGGAARWLDPERSRELSDCVAAEIAPLLPTPTARDWKDGAPCANVEENAILGRVAWSVAIDFGKYQAAVDRWARVVGTPPTPTDDKGRLNPPFVEWMIGYPAGWVTDLGLTRTAQLKALGNAVQPQAGAAAYAALARRAERLEAAA